MMKQLVIFFFLIDGLLGSNSLYAQKTELMPDGQRTFFEGYWKYASQNRDTVFIIKLKYLPIENGLNCYIGSYLYFDPEIKENNFQVLSDYLDMNTYEEFWEVYFESLRAGNNFIAIDVSGKNFYEMTGSFYDYKLNTYHGKVTLSVVSAQEGAETIMWHLEEGEGIFFYAEGEEDPNDMFNFSVPWNIVLEKMHDLTEFEYMGIVLPSLPQRRSVIKEDK